MNEPVKRSMLVPAGLDAEEVTHLVESVLAAAVEAKLTGFFKVRVHLTIGGDPWKIITRGRKGEQ